jgi:hypothetical protein
MADVCGVENPVCSILEKIVLLFHILGRGLLEENNTNWLPDGCYGDYC